MNIMAKNLSLILLILAVTQGVAKQPSLGFAAPFALDAGSPSFRQVSSRGRTYNTLEDVIAFRGSSARGSRTELNHANISDRITGAFDSNSAAEQSTCVDRSSREILREHAMAKQHVNLLEGTVPLAAHEAIIHAYEKHAVASLAELAASGAAGMSALASDFLKRHREMREQLEARETALGKANANLHDMFDSLAGLKRDVSLLRAALNTHASRTEENRKALMCEIRQNEVEPQRKRADAAEAELTELREAAQGWLSTAHASRMEAAAEARATGYLQGRSEASAEANAENLSLRSELKETHDTLADHRARSREERLVLREAVAEARADAYTLVSKAGTAGTAAIEASRDDWRAQGYTEGFAQGQAHAEAELTPRLIAAESSGKTTRAEETQLRDAFAAYVISAHEQRLKIIATERAASKERVEYLAEELAGTRSALARMLQERITELEARRDAMLQGDAAIPKKTVADAPPQSPLTVGGEVSVPFNFPGGGIAKHGISEPFWQECGGRQPS